MQVFSWQKRSTWPLSNFNAWRCRCAGASTAPPPLFTAPPPKFQRGLRFYCYLFDCPMMFLLRPKEVLWDIPGSFMECFPGSRVRGYWEASGICSGGALELLFIPSRLPRDVLRMPWCRLCIHAKLHTNMPTFWRSERNTITRMRR